MKARCEMNRRTMIKASAAVGLGQLLSYSAATFASAARPECAITTKGVTYKAHPERAISLRQLSESLKAGKTVSLKGLTRLDGFIIDQENRDIIVWGLSERGRPDLHVQDFVVALRSAHGAYTVKRDRTTYIASPLISIDPDVAVLARLREINVMNSKGKKLHADICKSPQVVRIEGMPRNSRVAKVLVDADYRMKMVSQGLVKLAIKFPFPSSFSLRVKKWREEAAAAVKSHSFNTRYWFQPGKFSYQVSADASTTFLDTAEVVLNDEDQFLRDGALVASGKTDDVARDFSCAWTSRMEDIYKAEPIWRDMHNIFRHFAVARIMSDRNAFAQAGFDGEFLLNRYVLEDASVPSTLAGLGRIDEYETRNELTKMQMAYSVCGGVSVAFNKPLSMNADDGGTRESGRSVIVARPSVTTVAWSITPGSLRTIFNRSKSKTPARTAPSSEPKKPSLSDLFKT